MRDYDDYGDDYSGSGPDYNGSFDVGDHRRFRRNRDRSVSMGWSRPKSRTMRCRRCGRALTTPESIASGIGPVCASKERKESEHEY
jgi:hypothetical protein